MECQKLAATLVAAVMLALGLAMPAAAVSYVLGNQDFADGQILSSVAEFNAASGDDPVPFDQFYGDDFGTPFSQSWTFNYPPMGVAAASITFGIFDHDSQASGSQVAFFELDGNDLSSGLFVAFESHGGSQTEVNIYSVGIPDSILSTLADGSATFSLALKGPSLIAGGEASGNGAGLDFAILDLTPVPEPTTAALLLALSSGLALLRHRRRGRGISK